MTPAARTDTSDKVQGKKLNTDVDIITEAAQFNIPEEILRRCSPTRAMWSSDGERQDFYFC